MLVVDPTFRPTINQVQEHLASISSAGGFGINNGDGDTELDLELSSLNSPPNIQESASNESLQSSVSATTTSETAVSSSTFEFIDPCFQRIKVAIFYEIRAYKILIMIG